MTCTFTDLLTAAAAASLLCISCDRSTSLSYGESPDGPSTEVSVAYLRSLCRDVSVPITGNVTIRGRVTANDAYGEFYKSIVVEDATAGIEVEIDRTQLYTLCPLYCEVRIMCQGLSLGRYGSRIELGANPTGDYVVDRISAADIGRYMTVNQTSETDFSVPATTVAQIGQPMIGRTVRIRSLHAVGDAASWCDTDPETGKYVDSERTVADESGVALVVRVRGDAVYAHEPMPAGNFALCGIIEYSSGVYALRITNRGIETER